MKISFLITLLLAAAACSHGQELVKDSAGHALKIGQKYFIQPTGENNKGGGLVPASRYVYNPFACPLVVTQTILSYVPGVPVGFALTVEDSSEADVKTDTYVTIEYKDDFGPFCTEYSKFWAVDTSKTIIIGGEPENKNSHFKIKKAAQGIYTLISSEGSVGATQGTWLSASQLVVNDKKPVPVIFKKFEEPTPPASLRMFPSY